MSLYYDCCGNVSIYSFFSVCINCFGQLLMRQSEINDKVKIYCYNLLTEAYQYIHSVVKGEKRKKKKPVNIWEEKR